MSRIYRAKKPLMELEGFRLIGTERIEEELYLFVIKMHAEFNKPKIIQRAVEAKYGKECYFGSSLIRINNLINDPNINLVVASYRTAYLNRIKDVPISHKRVRLEDLNEVRDKIMAKIADNNLRDAEEVREFLSTVKSLNETLSNAREEIEGKSIVFNQLNVIGDFNDKSDDELIARRDELIKQAERSLDGISAGINYDPERVEDAKVIEPA